MTIREFLFKFNSLKFVDQRANQNFAVIGSCNYLALSLQQAINGPMMAYLPTHICIIRPGLVKYPDLHQRCSDFYLSVLNWLLFFYPEVLGKILFTVFYPTLYPYFMIMVTDISQH